MPESCSQWSFIWLFFVQSAIIRPEQVEWNHNDSVKAFSVDILRILSIYSFHATAEYI